MLELQGSTLRQCAWCWMVVDGSGSYNVQPGRKIRSATHGICPTCKETMRAEIDGTSYAVATIPALHRDLVAA
jgi:hypothetical protein